MHEAMTRGFHYRHPDWANLGQGAPETGALPEANPRLTELPLDPAAYEYAPRGRSPRAARSRRRPLQRALPPRDADIVLGRERGHLLGRTPRAHAARQRAREAPAPRLHGLRGAPRHLPARDPDPDRPAAPGGLRAHGRPLQRLVHLAGACVGTCRNGSCERVEARSWRRLRAAGRACAETAAGWRRPPGPAETRRSVRATRPRRRRGRGRERGALPWRRE